MKITDTKRIFRSGYKNFIRNGVVSFSSLTVLTITLSVIIFLIFSNVVLSNALKVIESQVDITVYFVPSAKEDQILDFEKSIQKLPEVLETKYKGEDENLINFRARHENDYLTLQALDELNDNPLGATLDIKALDPSKYDSIVKFLDSDTGLSDGQRSIVDTVNYHENKLVIDRINTLIRGSRTLGFAVTLILVIISILITYNTIRLAIYFAKEEIGIMRLVGAGNSYISGPFIVEGILYGLIASLVTLILFLPITYWFGRSLADFLGVNIFTYFTHNIVQIFGIILISGILICIFSSLLAIRRYLKK